MSKFSKSKIYKIYNIDNNDEVYIGSTIQDLNRRFENHKTTKTITLFQLVNKKYNGDWSKFKIELIKEFPCETILDLRKEEEKYRLEFATINKCRAFVSDEIRKELKAKKDKRYREKHNVEIKQRKANYYKDNAETIIHNKKEKVKCICGCEVRRDGLKEHQKSKKHIDLISK